MKTITIVANSLIAGFLLCSCSTPRPSAQSFEPVRFSAQTQHLLPTPSMLKEEYSHPSESTRHTFSWGSHGTDWTLTEKTAPMEYAGFYIRRPLDLGHFAQSQRLQFSVRPLAAAANLTLVLISGNGQMLRLPGESLADYPSKAWLQGWHTFKIDVGHFQHPVEIDQGDFDWTDVRQIRLVKIHPDIQLGKVEIRNLRFRPETFAMLR